ncbi:MAG: iron-sulfur cluster assembly accessory protein [Calditrichaeota bacterium]|nr:iron-sulfur cluster assembly accessory protein [Calditrichota bacterium]
MITVTESAVRQVRTLVEEQKDAPHLRIGVQGGGCSGLEYYLALDDTIQTEDEVYEFGGIKVLVDRQSLPYLTGSTLDFSNDLMNSGFTFHNPNAARTCGCGKSFCG